jgi:hypothetical protein
LSSRRGLFIAVALLVACGEPPKPTAPTLDPDRAKAKVQELVTAIESGDRSALRRSLSFVDLSRSTRPPELRTFGRTTENRFEEAATKELLDPQGPVRRLFSNLELGNVALRDGTAIVEGKSASGQLRFVVAPRAGRILVVRVE